MEMTKARPISMYAQGGMLRHFFPDSTLRIIRFGKGLIWEGKLQPSDLSITYNIRIEYNMGKDPNVYVINPYPLPLAKDTTKLPHIYSNPEKQHLCLYHRRMNEWNECKMIARTIIPWTSEWLLHYEIWIVTGTWQGGGIH